MAQALKTEHWHDANFVVTGGNGGSHYECLKFTLKKDTNKMNYRSQYHE